jgi:PilZ domain
MIKDKRKSRRQPMRYSAWVALTPDERHGCVLFDVSDSGARIELQDSAILPEHFLLLLSANGAARRYCHVVWRQPNQVGVKFEASLPESADATLAPKSDADAQAAPAPEAAAEPAKST